MEATVEELPSTFLLGYVPCALKQEHGTQDVPAVQEWLGYHG